MSKLTKSPTQALLEESGEEPTRENYLNLAFLGNPPSKLHPEEEDQLPAPFQKGYREMDKSLKDRAAKKQEAEEKKSEKKA